MLRLLGITQNRLLAGAIGAVLLVIGITASRPVLMVVGGGIVLIGALGRGRSGDSSRQ